MTGRRLSVLVLVGLAASTLEAAETWWSLRPLHRPAVPTMDRSNGWGRTPIDAFVLRKLNAKGLVPAAEADRRTLIRRLRYDLHGLPPAPKEVEAFVGDKDPNAYEKLVDRLLASPRYGERWARHWLDVVHYADTHGYDKDKLRPNAWPYRDYVIRAFNKDKPYERFVREQVAGDVLWPNTLDGVVATGLMAAGPWDFIGHVEVSESKIDGKVARNIDRDDMVRTVIQAFNSVTVGCARCHNHKFDPITTEHYYSLQAIFASLDRADRTYEPDAAVAKRRAALVDREAGLNRQRAALQKRIRDKAGPPLAVIDKKLATLTAARQKGKHRPEFGYHSRIAKAPTATKWVQVDLKKPVNIDKIVLVGCHDNFNDIGAGFGFPVRFRIQLSNDPTFTQDVITLADHTGADTPNPGVQPQTFEARGRSGRFIRVTATKLANRLSTDYIFALGELMALDAKGKNLARGAKVTSADSIQAKPRWRRSNLVDGYYYAIGSGADPAEIARLEAARRDLLARVVDPALSARLKKIDRQLTDAVSERNELPKGQRRVYAAVVHKGKGKFRGRAGLGPRPIHVLDRGEVTKPGKKVGPGVPPFIPGANWRFSLPADKKEGDGRVLLAQWLVRKDHPLTWRSIVNRVWSYHFGRGLADSPNDLGRMGRKPTHPQLLDWLAAEFRDGGQSLKKLHKLIVTSAVYRQASTHHPRNAARDRSNQYLWRMNRRRLDAESIRDSVLVVAGKMNFKMGGPGYRDFVLEKTTHSPHYEYEKHNPDDVSTHRRSIYRFIVRSQTQPLMTTFDCADPAQMVAKRGETLTALQALALMNNPFMVRMYEHMAGRLARESGTTEGQIDLAFRRALGRPATDEEKTELAAYAKAHGMANVCRLVMNLNELVFVD